MESVPDETTFVSVFVDALFGELRGWEQLKLLRGSLCGVVFRMTATFCRLSKSQIFRVQSKRWIKNNLGSFERGFVVHCSSASAVCLYRWAEASGGGWACPYTKHEICLSDKTKASPQMVMQATW